MSELFLVANEVLLTNYGHTQVVYDPDGIWDTGDELEIEVQAPFLLAGDWDVRPVQPHDIPFLADTERRALTAPSGVAVDDLWSLLVSTRDYFSGLSIDYRLGLSGLEGQNSNTYVNTLAHIVGLDISAAVASLLANPDYSSFPGIARNVLFSQHDSDGTLLPPVALTLTGTDGNDRISGGNSADNLNGAGGDDILTGHSGRDRLDGGDGNDSLLGGNGRDTLRGDAGNDILFGDAGRDFIFGLDDDDQLNGGTGSDRMYGGTGNDILSGNGGSDRVYGGQGTDEINGDAGNDSLYGQAMADELNGQAGQDSLFGGGGGDTLNGGGGSDELTGGGGHDMLTGGGGVDYFVFNGLVNEGADEITDFRDGFDMIRVTGLTFDDIDIAGSTSASITLNGLTEITLSGVSASLIDVGDFDFV